MIVDVEASTAVRTAEVTAACTMIERANERFGLWPERLAADSAYGSAETLNWLVHERGIEPHIPVIDKSAREDGTFSRADFTYDHAADLYRCPAGKELRSIDGSLRIDHPEVRPDGTDALPRQQGRLRRLRSQAALLPRHPGAQGNRARSTKALATWRATSPRPTPTSPRGGERKKVEMLFAHLKRILRLDRLRLRGPNGARDEFLLAATAQNLRKLAKLLPQGPQIRPA